jgi:hypothetical protein
MAVCYLRIADKCYAHEKLGNREKAIEQCNKALKMDDTSMKAIYRRGQVGRQPCCPRRPTMLPV